MHNDRLLIWLSLQLWSFFLLFYFTMILRTQKHCAVININCDQVFHGVKKELRNKWKRAPNLKLCSIVQWMVKIVDKYTLGFVFAFKWNEMYCTLCSVHSSCWLHKMFLWPSRVCIHTHTLTHKIKEMKSSRKASDEKRRWKGKNTVCIQKRICENDGHDKRNTTKGKKWLESYTIQCNAMQFNAHNMHTKCAEVMKRRRKKRACPRRNISKGT